VVENNLLPESENIKRKDLIVEELYKLETLLKPKDDKYILQIQEFERSHNYFYGFELLKVAHSKNTKLAVTFDNKIIPYGRSIAPSEIRDKKGKDWTKELSEVKDSVFFSGNKGDSLKLKFNNFKRFKNPMLILRSSIRGGEYCKDESLEFVNNVKQKVGSLSSKDNFEGELLKFLGISAATALSAVEAGDVLAISKDSIVIKMMVDNRKEEFLHIHPRENFCSSIIDLSKYAKDLSEDLEMELEWTSRHALSFIGLTEAEDVKKINIETLGLENLNHSHEKEITKKSLKDGKAELIPGQFIELTFPCPKENLKANEKTSFILKTRGFYKHYIP